MREETTESSMRCISKFDTRRVIPNIATQRRRCQQYYDAHSSPSRQEGAAALILPADAGNRTTISVSIATGRTGGFESVPVPVK